MTNPIKFTFTPGDWRYGFRDKETLLPLTSYQYLSLEEEITITIQIPEFLAENKNARLFAERIRG